MKKIDNKSLALDNNVKRLLPAPTSYCARDLRWLSKQPVAVLVKFKAKEQKAYFDLKKREDNSEVSTEVLAIVAMFSTAYHFRRLLEKSITPGAGVDLDALTEIEGIVIAKHGRKRRRPKMDTLDKHLSLIRAMCKEQFSLRRMSEVLAIRARESFSHTTIAMYIDENKSAIKGADDA